MVINNCPMYSLLLRLLSYWINEPVFVMPCSALTRVGVGKKRGNRRAPYGVYRQLKRLPSQKSDFCGGCGGCSILNEEDVECTPPHTPLVRSKKEPSTAPTATPEGGAYGS